jgi:hypothetical protein
VRAHQALNYPNLGKHRFTKLNHPRPAFSAPWRPPSSARLVNRSSSASLRSRAPFIDCSTSRTSHASTQRIPMPSRTHTPVVHTANGAAARVRERSSPPAPMLAFDSASSGPKAGGGGTGANPKRAAMRAKSVRGCARRCARTTSVNMRSPTTISSCGAKSGKAASAAAAQA